MIDLTQNAGFNLPRRRRAELRFKLFGRLSIMVSLSFLLWMLATIVIGGIGSARLVQVAVPVDLGVENVDPENIRDASFGKIVKSGLRDVFPNGSSRKDKKSLYSLVSPEGSFELENMLRDDASMLGATRSVWLTASDDLSLYVLGKINVDVPEDQRQISDKQIFWINQLQEYDSIRTVFNWRFITNGDSREPEIAGILAAFTGSALSLITCFTLSFPLGIAAATYLEEFAPANRLSYVIEVNINNLAAVPSIVFGLLGLSIFLGYFDLPCSSPLVGGMVLSLMTLPTIIIASRASLKSVPPR